MNFSRRIGGATAALFCALFATDLMAHEDLDIGIASVRLNKQCHAEIQVKNFGGDLPESFYMIVRPAYVTVQKGDQQEELKSLRTLDKKHALAKSQGTLTIISKKTYSGNPKPIDVQTQIEGPFIDFGAANSRLRESMDCVPGKGQVAGEPIPETQPDIYVETARIDPAKCELDIRFGNLSSVGLTDHAWDEADGVYLMSMSLPSHERQEDIPLIRLDPQKRFTRDEAWLTYHMPLPKLDVEQWRVGLWRVLDERDFPNNQIDIPVPDACRATPR